MNASLTALAESLVGWLADFYLLATLLLGLSFLGLRWVRQPVHRLSVAWIVMIELGALAVLCAMPGWPRISLAPAAPKTAAVPAPPDIDLQPSPEPAVGWVERSADPPARLPSPMVGQRFARPTLPDPQPRWTFALPACSVLVGGGFLLGMAVIGCWLGWGAVAAIVLCRRATAAPPGLIEQLSKIVDGPRLPRLLLSGQIGNAVALGVVRPAILLPANLAQDGPSQSLRAVLAHEWAHIRNHDLWLLALGRCLLAILFAHPLFWWLRRRIRNDQEMVADAVAARENRPDYAEDLLHWLRLTSGLPSAGVSAAVGIWESPSQLTRRIATLLDDSFHVQTAASRLWKFQAVGLLVLLGAACSLVTLQPARLAGEPAPATSAATSEPETNTSPVAAQPAAEAKQPVRNDPAKEFVPAREAKEPNAAARTMRVRVVGPDDKPVAETKVYVRGVAGKEGQSIKSFDRDYVCDADGQTVIDLPQAVRFLDLYTLRNNGYLRLSKIWGSELSAGGYQLPQDLTVKLVKLNPEQAKALAEIENRVGEIYIGVEESDQGRRVTIQLGGDAITDADMDPLRRLPDPDELSVIGPNVTDAGLAHLESLHSLKTLTLGCEKITDAGLAHLEGLQGLKVLELMGPKITDAGLVHLQPLHDLEKLTLACAVTEAGMKHLTPLKELRTLVSYGVKADPTTRKVFNAIEQPTQFDFTKTPLSDVCAYLSDYHNIKVQPDAVAVGNAGLEKDIPVTYKTKDVPFGIALLAMLEPLGLDWVVEQGAVIITTREITAKRHPEVDKLQRALPNLKLVIVETAPAASPTESESAKKADSGDGR